MGEREEFFRRNGYVIVRQALDAAEIARTRAALADHFSRTEAKRRQLFPSESFRIPEVCRAALNPKIVEALKEILEPEYTMMPDIVVHRNVFGYGKNGGWHTDAGCEGRAPYLVAPDFRFIKCGVYLQDNTTEWGGGIDVAPGGHRFPFASWAHPVNFKAKHVLDDVRRRLFGRRVDLRAGDFLCFDTRLPHTSTLATKIGLGQEGADHLELPPDKTKFVVYWGAGRSKFLADFLQNSERRALTEEAAGKTRGEFFYLDYLRFKRPESFPKDFLAAAQSAGIRIGTIAASKADEWERRYRQAVKEFAPSLAA